MTRDRRAAVAILALVAIAGGVAASINSLGAPFMADRGEQLWRLYSMNTLGGVVTIASGVVALAAAAMRSKPVAALAGVLFLGAAGLTLIALGQTYNLLGGRGWTVSFWLTFGIGLVALAISPEVEAAPSARSAGSS